MVEIYSSPHLGRAQKKSSFFSLFLITFEAEETMEKGIYYNCQQKRLCINGVCFQTYRQIQLSWCRCRFEFVFQLQQRREGGHAGPWSRDGLTTSVASVLKSPPSRPLSGLFRTQHFSARKFTFDNFLLLSKHFQPLRRYCIRVYKIYILYIMAKCILGYKFIGPPKN